MKNDLPVPLRDAGKGPALIRVRVWRRLPEVKRLRAIADPLFPFFAEAVEDRADMTDRSAAFCISYELGDDMDDFRW